MSLSDLLLGYDTTDSNNLPSRFDVSVLNRISFTVLSLLPVAIKSPIGVHARQ
jgi:hypothetical protein